MSEKNILWIAIHFVGLILLIDNQVYSQPDQAETIRYESFAIFLKINDNDNIELPLFDAGEIPVSILPISDDILPVSQVAAIKKASRLPDARLQRTYKLILKDSVAIDRIIASLQQQSFIEYAERVPIYRTSFTPNDLHPNQWYLQQINAELAWDISTGSNTVNLAIVDNAVSTLHQDLVDQLWVNPGEIPGNGIDDDANGYVDDINGYDVADNDNDPNPPAGSGFTFSHGTHCAGISAATTDNNLGIASIGYGIDYIAVKCSDNAGAGYWLTYAYEGVEYAIAAGADVISMSFGGSGYSQTWQNLFDVANNLGIVCIAAAGNSNTNIVFYPAGYNHVIAVGASDPNDLKAGFSNYGTWVDIFAPGTDIWSTMATSPSSYSYMSGTSMACPLVSGLAGLMLSIDPSLSPQDLLDCLQHSAFDMDPGNPGYAGQLGAGRIDAEQAMICLAAIIANFQADFTQVCPNATINFTDLSTNNPTAWQWFFPGGTPPMSTVQHPTVTYPNPGVYDVTLIATNGNGTDTLTRPGYITIAIPTGMMSGNATIVAGNSANIQVDLTGKPPWTITYTDGITPVVVNNINTTPYFITVAPVVTTNYTLTAVNDTDCSGTATGGALVTVIPQSGQMDSVGLFFDGSNDRVTIPQNGAYDLGTGDFTLEAWIKADPNQVSFPEIITHRSDPTGFDGFLFGLWMDGKLYAQLDGLNQPRATGGDLRDNSCHHVALARNGNNFTYYIDGNPAGGFTSSRNINTDSPVDLWIGDDQAHNTGQTPFHGHIKEVRIWNIGRTAPEIQQSKDKFLCGNETGLIGYWRLNANSAQTVTDHSVTGNNGFLGSTVTNDANDPQWQASCPVMTESCLPAVACINIKTLQKISNTQGNFNGALDIDDAFGGKILKIWDVDQDGVEDLMVAATRDDDGGLDKGGVWILLMNTNGTVKGQQKISETQGGFGGSLGTNSSFGSALDTIGDMDGDGVMDLVIGNGNDNDGGTRHGAVWIVFMNANGTVKSEQKISDTQGGFTGVLSANSRFGVDVACIGDLDGDGINDLAVGGDTDPGGGVGRGSVWILFMNANGTVKNHQTINSTQGNLSAPFDNDDLFGISLAHLGDLDGDGTSDLAVGARLDDDGGTDRGAVYILFLNNNGTVKSYQKISDTQGGLLTNLNDIDRMGAGLSNMNDLNGDSITDICVGSYSYDGSGTDRGRSVILFLNTDGTVKDEFVIDGSHPLINGLLDDQDYFGWAAENIGDLDSNGVSDLVISAHLDDDGGANKGAVYVLFLEDTCNTIIQPCSVSASFTYFPDTSLCEGTSDSITFSNTSTASASATYSWVFGPMAIPTASSQQHPPAVYFSQPGSYDVRLIVNDTCGSDTMIRSVKVFPSPVKTDAGEDTVICFDGDSVPIGSNPVASFIYNWQPALGLSDPGVANPRAFPDTTTTYVLHGVDAVSGCASADTVTVTVVRLVAAGDTLICEGGAAQLFASGVDNYQWLPPASLNDPASADPVASPDSSITYQVIGNSALCGADTASVTIQVDLIPEDPAGRDTSICFQPDSISIGIDHIAGYTYNWKPITGLSNPASADPNALPDTATTYILSGINTVTGCTFEDTVHVSFVSFHAAGDTSLCEGGTVQLTASGMDAYQWLPANVFDDPASSDPLAQVDSSLTLQVIGTSLICGADTLSVSIEVFPELVVDAGENVTILIGEEVQLDACCGDFYRWSPVEGLDDPEIANPVATPEVTTVYRVQVSDSNGCAKADSLTVSLEKDLFIPTMFSPNGDGVNDRFRILGSGIGQLHWRIYNRWGEIVYETSDVTEATQRGWDGAYKGRFQGTEEFVWHLTGEFADGSELNYKGKNVGAVALIR